MTEMITQKLTVTITKIISITRITLIARAYQWSTSVTSDWIMDRRNDF